MTVEVCITENQCLETKVEILVRSIDLGKPVVKLMKKENRNTDDGLC